ncbi:amidohydrolase [Pseudomonas sp. 91RF]|jgi:predicted TIM-barrel fold metal-dependent hydrolase|uniref:amidohydrolase family protein n=1 Tax=Pseudomonas sp. 91RF TaxID=2292261 RepID=UPI000E674D4A|nr:amidohydrolase family protein [Pseudomonas sp. 91RF]RIJ13158.1 amidohydrolase [Pseudomonas sp. 91RF]
MSIKQGRIDVHHHIIPPAFVEAMNARGLHSVAGAPLPDWTPEKSIEVMDANGIERAITSLSAPGVHFGDGVQQASELARRCNEFAAQMRTRYPSRFGNFAVLPMPFTEAACREAVYALDVLKAEGIVLLGSTDGVFLGDPRFDELMAELDRRKAVVFIHPNMHQTSESIGLQTPGFLIEFLCDTTRAAVNLILSGSMERYPGIRWILSHSGGFLPFVAWRVSLANMLPEFQQHAPQGVMTYIRRFYFDTALSPSPYSMAALKELVEPSHILFGSDYPFAPAPATALQCRTLESLEMWSPAIMHGINRAHALSLFPQYSQPNEVVTPAPIFEGESFSQRLRRSMTRPIGALAERMRKR